MFKKMFLLLLLIGLTTVSFSKQRYSLIQAVSDKAQLHTIAFDGLAFMTGTMESNTFLPPGKVADYFGFQYMRDIDKVGGHKMSFLTQIAANMLKIFSEEQTAMLVSAARDQAPLLQNSHICVFL
jgi:hypothetical protein